MGGALHLASRFVGSLSPRPLAAVDAEWVAEVLTPAEATLWTRMSRADQKHAAGVARAVHARLPDADRWVLVAALLHDVGKVETGFGTFARVVATLVGAVAGRDRFPLEDGPGFRARLGRYLHHDRLGAALLAQAGAPAEAVHWAADHHRPRSQWRVPETVGAVLHEEDDD